MTLITIRAELSKEQWRDLRALALERDISVQQLVGEILVERLEVEANGRAIKEAAQRR